jgi:hypothetical protein
MKRRITLSIALILSIVSLLLIKSDSTAAAPPPQRFVADTGIIIPGPHQRLRLSVTGDFNPDGDVDGSDYIVFRRMEYVQASCTNGAPCKLSLSSQSATEQIRLRPGEATFLDIVDGTSNTMMGYRGMVTSSRRNVRVTLQLIDRNTGEVQGVLIALINGLPGVN